MDDLAPTATHPDPAQIEAFAGRLGQALNDAALVQMCSIGHRTGLFDTLARLPPSTSARVATAAALDERYVREWLAALVTARVVSYDPHEQTYALPAAHAACLTRAATPNNIAVTCQMMPLMGAMEDRIIDRFRHGGGTCYHEYPRFHEVMAEDSGQTIVAGLFDGVLPLVDGLQPRLQAGIDVLDAGCGRGHALMAMAARYPRSRFTGCDLCEDAIAWATDESRRRGLQNLHFEVRDLSDFASPSAFDFITTFDAVHDQKDPAGLLAGIARSLRPGGVYLMQDIAGSSHLERNLDHPFGTFIYTVSCMHCMPVSLGQGGAGLGTMWGEELAVRMLHDAGFPSVERRLRAEDPLNVYFVARI
ncbi:MAG: class I SAM-dependent methyltransferase [Sinimarinibacterium flocculans]|uniref:class I SAM-dependent methyltransferase n=1 Tax=Sinimarinibacterium flocculans TaxID=985250 RepID=UPI003C495204